MDINEEPIDKIEDNISCYSNDYELKNFIENYYFPKNYDKNGVYYSKIFKRIESGTNELYFCPQCHSYPSLFFNNETLQELHKITYSCKCINNPQTISIDEFNTKFKKNKNEISEEIAHYSFCDVCHEKFNAYCPIHEKNLCKNYKSEGLIHSKDNIINFDDHMIFKYFNYLKIKLNIDNEEKNERVKAKYKNFNSFENLVIIIIINYILYRNYEVYNNIKNLYNALTEFTIHCYKNKIETPFEIGIDIIKNLNELNDLDSKVYPLIINLYLKQSRAYNIKNLDKFENLKELNLADNCIYDIKSFLKAKWKNLRVLNLSTNKLGDENIKYFRKLDLKELDTLVLDYNNFTNYELLIAIANNKKNSFKKLVNLRVGLNNFRVAKTSRKKDKKKDLNININKEIKIEIKIRNDGKIERKTLDELKIDFSNLDFRTIKKLVINHGALNQKTAETLFPIMNLNNLEILDISNNNLTNINFVKKCNCNLKSFDYSGNHIKDEND